MPTVVWNTRWNRFER